MVGIGIYAFWLHWDDRWWYGFCVILSILNFKKYIAHTADI